MASQPDGIDIVRRWIGIGDGVLARTTTEDVRIVAGLSIKLIVAGSTIENIIAGTCQDNIITSASDQYGIALLIEKMFIAAGAIDNIVTKQSIEIAIALSKATKNGIGLVGAFYMR